MKRPWKIRDGVTGRILHTYSTDERAINNLWMFMGDSGILAEYAKRLELVGPDGIYPVAGIVTTMKTIAAIYDTGKKFSAHAIPLTDPPHGD